jgi:hypothetical protein
MQNTGFEVGKVYSLKNGKRITVTNIGRRSFDKMLLVSYLILGTNTLGDTTPNSLHWQIDWEAA